MQPYNNQPIGINQAQQPQVQPVSASNEMVQPQSISQSPKKGNGKGTILLILLLLLIIGIAVYALFAKNQLNHMQKTSTDTTAPIPQSPGIGGGKAPSISPSTPQDGLNIDSPESDLQGIEKDVSGL